MNFENDGPVMAPFRVGVVAITQNSPAGAGLFLSKKR
jgi:hypothetical protein